MSQSEAIFAAVGRNPIHPFPARMAPGIVWDRLGDAGAKPLVVLDPMAGSGTTVVASRLRGHYAIGFDSDPLAVLIATTWATDVAPDFMDSAVAVLEVARILAQEITHASAYPEGADDEMRAFIRYWYDYRSRRELAALAQSIQAANISEQVRLALWTAFSRLIIVKQQGVSLAMDVSHSRPHRVFEKAPLSPFDGFLSAAQVVAKNSPFSSAARGPRAVVSRADARSLPLESDSVDVVITSPPYSNAIDYVRGHRLSLVWMRHSLDKIRALRSGNIGTERGAETPLTPSDRGILHNMTNVHELRPRHVGILSRFIQDMRQVVAEIARVLVPGGVGILVVGDTTHRGVLVSNSRGIEAMCVGQGLAIQRLEARPLAAKRRYLPPPENRSAGAQLSARMNNEVIITAVKRTGPLHSAI